MMLLQQCLGMVYPWGETQRGVSRATHTAES